MRLLLSLCLLYEERLLTNAKIAEVFMMRYCFELTHGAASVVFMVATKYIYIYHFVCFNLY